MFFGLVTHSPLRGGGTRDEPKERGGGTRDEPIRLGEAAVLET